MARSPRITGPSVLTANDLLTGAIVYWTGAQWSPNMAAAQHATGNGIAALMAVGGEAEAANVVVGAYVITLDPATGAPSTLREARRLAGPSIPLPVPSRSSAA